MSAYYPPAAYVPANLTFTPGTTNHNVAPISAGNSAGGTLAIAGAATLGTGGVNAGDVSVTGGAAGAVTGANGGNVLVTGGAAGGFSLGGNVTIKGGASGGTGGNVTVDPGAALGNGTVKIGATVVCNVTVAAATGALGFYGAAPQAKPNITGAKGGNAALGSLLTALASLGLITDNTTA